MILLQANVGVAGVLEPLAVTPTSGKISSTGVRRVLSDDRCRKASDDLKQPVQVGDGNNCCDRYATAFHNNPVITVVDPFEIGRAHV